MVEMAGDGNCQLHGGKWQRIAGWIVFYLIMNCLVKSEFQVPNYGLQSLQKSGAINFINVLAESIGQPV